LREVIQFIMEGGRITKKLIKFISMDKPKNQALPIKSSLILMEVINRR